MSLNIVEWINGIIGGLIYALYGYVVACTKVLFSPIRAPLKYFLDTKKAEKNRLAPHSVLFMSAVFASISISWANYKKIGGASIRAVSGSQRFDDYSLLVITADAIIIFVVCDIIARAASIVARRRNRLKAERLLTIRHYQVAAALAVVSALSASWPVLRSLLPPRSQYAWAGWLWGHQWVLQLSLLAFLLTALIVVPRSGYSLAHRRWRSAIRLLAPACVCGGVLFLALSDFPEAYILRRPEMYLSQFFDNNITENYPSIAYSECLLKAPETLTITSTLINRGKYVSLVKFSDATVGIAQGQSAGYFDQEVGWFRFPKKITLNGQQSDNARLAILKPGDVLTVEMTFQDEKSFVRSKALVEAWQAELKREPGYDYFYQPSCFLSLWMTNLDKGGGRSVPNFNDEDNFWGEFGKTFPGDIAVE